MTQEELYQSLPHTPATKEDVAAYRRGIITGVMMSATPNVVGSLIAALEQAWIERDDAVKEVQLLEQRIEDMEKDREQLRRQLTDLANSIEQRRCR